MNKRKSVTISDIAKECGVSTATVSRVLNNTDYPISDDVKETVLKVSQKLNYKYKKSLNRTTVTNNDIIGVIIPNISNHYYSYLLQAIQDTAVKRNFSLIICSSHSNNSIENENIKLLLEKKVKGIMIVGINAQTQLLNEAMNKGCKILTLEQKIDILSSHVGFNFYKGATIALQYLYDMGHRKIGFAGASLDRSSRKSLYSGFLDSLKQHNIEFRKEYIFIDKNETGAKTGRNYLEFQIGKNVADYFSSLQDGPTAIFCINDMIALSAINHFNNNGLKVPEDISIIGFDNIPIRQIINPTLTTIDQSIYNLGTVSCDMMINMITAETETNMTVTLEPTLIDGDSVKKIIIENES